MSTATRIPIEELEEVPSPYPEPQLGFLVHEPRKVNNLTLIDGKTFLSTTVSGDITPAGAPDVGFFHDDTRFLSRLELKIGGQRTVVLSSSTEKTFASKIELTTSSLAQINSFDLPENKDKGVVQIDGRMVERMHAEMARRTVAIAAAIEARSAN